ncbi:MAG: valine--tRNA ligase [Acidimicrobiia bacterium]|nr:valine--tRNA ligase [Acidimicrobiia bacterium]
MKPTYDPADIESRWYATWEDSGAFRPEVNPDGEPFCIVIPPPNVTGVLHMGHALNLSIQDSIIRRKRMQGYAALWVPGMDHAGIATQNVVERELATEGLTRHDLGRERFEEQVWAWKARSGGRITQQIRTLGFSPDWSRERFTLDEGLSRAVREVFVTLYEEGLIYRGNRIVNWCPRCHTAISEIEVDYEDEGGELVHIEYPFVDGPLPDGTKGITVATTRAETMLGDTAVAVHPEDERYVDVVGKLVRLPLVNREIPIVADDGVEMEFGTGAVKVTPAHDPLDFEIGERHGLEPLKVIDTDANITRAGGRFVGMDRYEAREAIRYSLKEEGYLVKVEDHHHSVGHCSRCGTVVEPMLSLQWFVKVQPLVGPAIDSVKTAETRFIPKRWEKNYFHWMENLRDWCVSRQLWWGHRIPAWYCDDCDNLIVARDEPAECADCNGPLRPDEDVLDTWFSSALWPFSTLGWPDQTKDLERFYPTSVMVTAFDIIYFWVARMMKMGIHFMKETPFPDIAIHGLIRAEDGRKMSKSSGNALDPLELVERFGADSIRLTLLQSAAPGSDVQINEDWIDAGRRFGNKLWNALRFAVEHMDITGVPVDGSYPEAPGPEDAWVLARLHAVTAEHDRLLDQYRFSDAVGLLYNFAWSEVFDWYLEMAKTSLQNEERAATTRQTLGVVLRDLLKLLHPVIPFVTEELWSELGDGSMLITAAWPTPPPTDAPTGVDELQELVAGVRRFKAEHQLSPRTEVPVRLDDPDGLCQPWWRDQLKVLAGASISDDGAPDAASGHTRITAGRLQAFIPLAGLVDVDAERPRLEKAIAETEASLDKSHAKLSNANFVDRAPADVVEKERQKAAEFEAKLEKLRTQLQELG